MTFLIAILNLIGWCLIWAAVDKQNLRSVKTGFVIAGMAVFIISFFISTTEGV